MLFRYRHGLVGPRHLVAQQEQVARQDQVDAGPVQCQCRHGHSLHTHAQDSQVIAKKIFTECSEQTFNLIQGSIKIIKIVLILLRSMFQIFLQTEKNAVTLKSNISTEHNFYIQFCDYYYYEALHD